MLRSERTLMCPAAACARDRPSRYGRLPGPCRSGLPDPDLSPGPCSSRVPALDLFVIRRSQTTHPGHPVYLGHPASDARAIKVLTDLFSLFLLRLYRH